MKYLPPFVHSKEQKERYNKSLVDYLSAKVVTCPYHALSLVFRPNITEITFVPKDDEERDLYLKEVDHHRHMIDMRNSQSMAKRYAVPNMYRGLFNIRRYENLVRPKGSLKIIGLLGHTEGHRYSSYTNSATGDTMLLVEMACLNPDNFNPNGIHITHLAIGKTMSYLEIDFRLNPATNKMSSQYYAVIADRTYFSGTGDFKFIEEEEALARIKAYQKAVWS